MKCDELKPLVFSLNDIAYVDERAIEKNFENPHDHAVYKATEVDALLAKKDMEILNLKEENSYIKADSTFDRDKHKELLKSKDAEITELKARIQLDDDEMAGFLQLEEECGGGDLRKYIAELNQKLEDVQASAYAESVDAGMRERRLRRALWLARAWFCGRSSEYFSGMASRCKIGQEDFYREVSERARRYMKSSYKCKAKAEEYK